MRDISGHEIWAELADSDLNKECLALDQKSYYITRGTRGSLRVIQILTRKIQSNDWSPDLERPGDLSSSWRNEWYFLDRLLRFFRRA